MSDLGRLVLDALRAIGPRIAGWAALVLLVLTAQYWLGPLMVHAKVRQKRATRFTPGDQAPPLPDLLAPFFAETSAALQSAGFVATPLFHGATGDERHGSAAYFQLFQHPRHGDVATIMAMARPIPASGVPHTLLGFTAEFGDGSTQRTGNSPVESAVPSRPADGVARFPEERDAARLYALHRELVRRRGSRQRPVPLSDPIAYQRRQEQLTHQRMVSSGWYVAEADALRPTWKGACLASWRMLAPWKTWRAQRSERLRLQLVRDLGLA